MNYKSTLKKIINATLNIYNFNALYFFINMKKHPYNMVILFFLYCKTVKLNLKVFIFIPKTKYSFIKIYMKEITFNILKKFSQMESLLMVQIAYNRHRYHWIIKSIFFELFLNIHHNSNKLLYDSFYISKI